MELDECKFPPWLQHSIDSGSNYCTLSPPWKFLTESVKGTAVILQGKWEEAEAALLAQWTVVADGSFPEPSSTLKSEEEVENHCSGEHL